MRAIVLVACGLLAACPAWKKETACRVGQVEARVSPLPARYQVTFSSDSYDPFTVGCPNDGSCTRS
jgi:hypothetical protein